MKKKYKLYVIDTTTKKQLAGYKEFSNIDKLTKQLLKMLKIDPDIIFRIKHSN